MKKYPITPKMETLKPGLIYDGEITDYIDLSNPPASGEDYIKHVILEARKCAEVATAQIDERKLKKVTVKIDSPTVSTPTNLIPSQEWQECQVRDFSKTRMYITRIRSKPKTLKKNPDLEKMPDIENEKAWVEICSDSNATPTLSLILAMGQPAIEQVLEHLVNHVEDNEVLNHQLGVWIYALLVGLEIPLNPSTCSCLRLLARSCSVIRKNLNSSDSAIMATLNLFICLVARYFRQLDLAD